MRKILTLAAVALLGGCNGNLLTGAIGSPITIPTGGCTVHFDGSWDCSIGGAGGPVPEAVVPVTPAPPPVVDVPSAEEMGLSSPSANPPLPATP